MRKIFWIIFLLCCFSSLKGQVVVTVAGIVETVGDQDGEALGEATFNNPHGIAVDAYGRVYIADRWNHRIRMLDTKTGKVSTLAGTGSIGQTNGSGDVAQFHSPWGIACDSIGNVYVADTKNQLIRKIDTAGIVSTVAGSGTFGVVDGPSPVAKFADPTGITLDEEGNLYVCDHVAHTIRKISKTGFVSTISGKAFEEGDVDGPGSIARFNRPYGIELDFDGNIVIADEWNHKIRRVTPDGTATTIAGSGSLGSSDGPTTSAGFNYPWDVVVDRDGVIYVMDGYNYVMRKIEGTEVSTFVGEAGVSGAQDGVGSEASFSGATTLCMEHRTGDIYVGDAFNELIRKVSPNASMLLAGETLISEDTICIGYEELFTVSPSIFVSYEFYVDGILQQNSTEVTFQHTFNRSGLVEIQAVGVDFNGFRIESNRFRIFVNEYPVSEFTFTPQTETGDGLTVDFEAFTPNAFYYWDFGDSISGSDNFSTEMNPSHTYSEYGTYHISLITMRNGGCADSITGPDSLVYSKLESNLFIPSAFTPNDDGVNDVLRIRGRGITDVELMIFNEWGQLIFRSRQLDEGWDGRHSGKLVPPDTYVYVAKIRTVDGVLHNLQGQTTVLR